jgi:hypothetical protein
MTGLIAVVGVGTGVFNPSSELGAGVVVSFTVSEGSTEVSGGMVLAVQYLLCQRVQRADIKMRRSHRRCWRIKQTTHY